VPAVQPLTARIARIVVGEHVQRDSVAVVESGEEVDEDHVAQRSPWRSAGEALSRSLVRPPLVV
jgi:hypothetical protein